MITNIYQYKNRALFHDGTLVRSPLGTEIGTLNSANWCDFTSAIGKVFVAAGYQSDNPVYVGDGPSFRITTAETDVGFKLRCAALVQHRGILYAGNVIDSDGSHVARLRWSAFGEPENFTPWGAGNYLNFQDVGDVDEAILRLFSFNNDLVIMKEHSIWIASGVASNEQGDISPANLRCVNTEYGLAGPKAAHRHAEKIVFLSNGGLMELYSDYSSKRVGTQFWQAIKDLPREKWVNACVEGDPSTETTYVGFPVYGSEIENWFVLNITGKWTRWNFTRNMSVCSVIEDNQGAWHTYFGDYSDGVYEMQPDLRVDFAVADAILATYETGWIDLGRTTLLRSLEFLARAEGKHEIYIDVYHDMSMDPFETKTLSLDAGDTIFGTKLDGDMKTATYTNFYPYIVDLSGHCRRVKFKIRTINKYDRFAIQQMKVGIIPRSGI